MAPDDRSSTFFDHFIAALQRAEESRLIVCAVVNVTTTSVRDVNEPAGKIPCVRVLSAVSARPLRPPWLI